MKHLATIFIVSLLSTFLHAQMKQLPAEVCLQVNDTIFAMPRQQTIIEHRQGWNVVGYQVGKKDIHYLWGRQSKQLCPSSKPTFIINPRDCSLQDYVLIKLKVKKQYRLLPKNKLRDNELLAISQKDFFISSTSDDRFAVTPRQPLPTGEYFLVNILQGNGLSENSYTGYCFTVE